MSTRDSRSLATLIFAGVLLGGCSPADAPTAPRLLPGGVHANVVADMVVTSTADDNSPGTLRHALNNAPDPGVIAIDPSLDGQTIVLALGELQVFKTLTVLGPGPQGITIDANRASGGISVLTIGNLTLKDATITRGLNTGNGGGIFADGPITLERVRLIDNRSEQDGGGLYTNKALSLIDSRVSGNTAYDGAGIVVHIAPAVIRGTTIADNVVRTFGGSGGGMRIEGTAATLTDISYSTISGNRTTFAGGISVEGAELRVSNTTISGNTTTNDGGGIRALTGRVSLRHVTVTGNSGGYGGGVVWEGGVPITFENVIIAGNTDNDPSDNANCGDGSMFGNGVTWLGTSIVGDASCGAANATRVIADPMLGPLADNGGATMTHEPLVGSPAIDVAPSCPFADDQRGLARPQGPKCDPGAVEFDDYIVPALAVEPAGTTNQRTGVATVGGTTTCSAAVTVTLRATVTQQQKNRKVPTTVTGSQDFTVDCAATKAWAVAVTPSTGTFNNSPAEVKVDVVSSPIWVAPASVTRTGVVMAWTRR